MPEEDSLKTMFYEKGNNIVFTKKASTLGWTFGASSTQILEAPVCSSRNLFSANARRVGNLDRSRTWRRIRD